MWLNDENETLRQNTVGSQVWMDMSNVVGSPARFVVEINGLRIKLACTVRVAISKGPILKRKESFKTAILT